MSGPLVAEYFFTVTSVTIHQTVFLPPFVTPNSAQTGNIVNPNSSQLLNFEIRITIRLKPTTILTEKKRDAK